MVKGFSKRAPNRPIPTFHFCRFFPVDRSNSATDSQARFLEDFRRVENVALPAGITKQAADFGGFG